jgi:hypothetical protein
MKMIAKSIEDFILRKYRSDKRVQLQSFNSATIITYINNMAIAEHRDQDFKNDGSFDQIKNSQIQDTATAVFCFGDPRHLDFTIHKVTQRKIEKICKSKSFHFKLRTNKSSSLLVHAGNLNVGVKGDYAKQGIVDASRKASNVPAHVFVMEIVPKI